MLNKVDECASDEWCAGAENFDEGFDTSNYKSLCVKGKIISIVVRQLWLMLYKAFDTNISNPSIILYPHRTSFMWKWLSCAKLLTLHFF